MRPPPSAAIFAQIDQIIRPHVEALGLEGIENERAHGHVRLVGQAGELLAQPLAQAERERWPLLAVRYQREKASVAAVDQSRDEARMVVPRRLDR
jgi:hypothetical protein